MLIDSVFKPHNNADPDLKTNISFKKQMHILVHTCHTNLKERLPEMKQ